MRTRRPRLLAGAAIAALGMAVAALPLLGDRAAATDRVITVAPGQTLSQIALEEGLTTDALASMNGISDPDRIFVGQQLIIRRDEPSAPPAVATDRSHTVAAGETLSGIALRYGTSVDAIVEANGITDPSYVRAGQVLAIPGASSGGGRGGSVAHRVVAGETLSGIALRYGTSVTAIVAANGIADPSYVRAGQVLRITAASSSAASAATPGARALPAGMADLVAQRRAVGDQIVAEARQQGVPAAFALAVAWQESGWQTGVVSSAGAIGVMQLLPSTAEWVADSMLGHGVNLWDPASNVQAGVALLRHYLDRYGGDRSLALAAYYQGQAATDRHGVYAVTRPYVASILALEGIFAG